MKTIGGLFETIGVFGILILISLSPKALMAGTTSQQRREIWLLNEQQGKSGRDLSEPDRRELIEGCTDSIEVYCRKLHQDLGLPPPIRLSQVPDSNEGSEQVVSGDSPRHKKRGRISKAKRGKRMHVARNGVQKKKRLAKGAARRNPNDG